MDEFMKALGARQAAQRRGDMMEPNMDPPEVDYNQDLFDSLEESAIKDLKWTPSHNSASYTSTNEDLVDIQDSLREGLKNAGYNPEDSELYCTLDKLVNLLG